MSDKPAWSRARERYADKMRNLGTPLMITPEEFQAVAELLDKAHRYGMSDRMIGAQTGVPYTLPSKVRRGVVETIHRDTYHRVMRLRPQRPGTSLSDARGKVGEGAQVDPTGTVRRMQALRADGFPGRVLGDRLGVSYEAVSQLARLQREWVLATTRAEVARLYRELDGKGPGDFGVSVGMGARCSAQAAAMGYAPRSCWDGDTIDDPDAEPEWTGRCGTWWGWHVHQRDGILVCARCAPFAESEPYPGFNGLLLRRIRERKGYSRTRLALAVGGLNASTIQYWETGRSKPVRQNKIDRVLSVLDVAFDEVCD